MTFGAFIVTGWQTKNKTRWKNVENESENGSSLVTRSRDRRSDVDGTQVQVRHQTWKRKYVVNANHHSDSTMHPQMHFEMCSYRHPEIEVQLETSFLSAFSPVVVVHYFVPSSEYVHFFAMENSWSLNKFMFSARLSLTSFDRVIPSSFLVCERICLFKTRHPVFHVDTCW